MQKLSEMNKIIFQTVQKTNNNWSNNFLVKNLFILKGVEKMKKAPINE